MARKLRPDEFEARNRQLPATHKRNLGGRSLGVSRKDLATTPLGAPAVDYDVRSTYDVRPVGGFDFNIVSTLTFDSISSYRVVEMTVPEGLVCVLRSFDLWFNPIPPGALKTDYTWTLTLNGGDVPYNQQIPFGIAVDDEKVFLLADEFNRVGIRFGAGVSSNLDSIAGYARFYGNFLLKTAVPLPFEIANKVHDVKRTPRSVDAPSRSPTPTTDANRYAFEHANQAALIVKPRERIRETAVLQTQRAAPAPVYTPPPAYVPAQPQPVQAPKLAPNYAFLTAAKSRR